MLNNKFSYLLLTIACFFLFFSCSQNNGTKDFGSISIKTEVNTMKIGERIELKYILNTESPNDYKIQWISEDVQIATIDEFGNVTGISEGKTNIILKAISNSITLTNTLSINVIPVEVMQIQLSDRNVEIEEGNSYQLQWTITPSNSTTKDLSWTSDNNDISSVNKGLITTHKYGTCNITAKSSNGITATCIVKVIEGKINNVTINQAGTLKEVIGGNNFLNFIRKIKITGNINGYDIETIRNMSNLRYLDLSDANLVPGGVYGGDNQVYENKIDNWMFYKMQFETIILPKSVTTIGFHAFDGCSKLSLCTLPDGLKSVGYASFMDCESLTKIDLPQSMTSIGYLSFLGCGLTEISIPNNVTKIGTSAFFECSNLKKISIGTNVNSISRFVFCHCTAIEAVYMYSIPNDNTLFATDMFDNSHYSKVTLYINKGSLESYKNTPFEKFENVVEL